MARSRKKLGEILAASGTVTKDQVDEATKKARSEGKRIGEAFTELGYASDEDVAKALASQFGIDYVDLKSDQIKNKIDLKLIPDDLIKKHFVLPLSKDNGRLRLIISDPMDLQLQDMLRFRLNVEIDPCLASKAQIKNYLEKGASQPRMVDAGESLVTESIDRTIDRSVDRSVDRSMDKSIDVGAADAPIVRLCTRILTEAVNMRASDIHVEPMANRVRLRYRIDGVCMERDNLPKRMQNAILSRLKLLAGVNIAEKRVPQDGRIKLPMEDNTVDFRVSACPAYHGESIVLRILRPESVKIGLINIGFEEDTLETFNKIIRRPNGIFLVTGPTGSGKTTTLYSALNVLNTPDTKIITAEDPIEYNFEGVNQCQVSDKIGLGFATILRTMLRQAPNVILVGEIRDKEVAEIAIQAALTGHLVFSTLHTNDAPGAITRLADMGVKPFLVASALQAIMAQRLIRTLCKECKTVDDDPDHKFLAITGIKPSEAIGRVHKAVGCDTCNGTGYRGRQGIFELMTMNSQIREMAFEGTALADIRKAAIDNGMRSLVQDGKIKVLRGITTPEEIARVTQVEGILEEETEETQVA